MIQRSTLNFALAVGILAVANVAHAHARMVASSPAAGATGAPPAEISVTFSEAPMTRFSHVELTNGAGAPVAVKSAKAAERDTLAVIPAAPLKPGVYRVTWRAVANDMHRTEGGFSFTVR